MPEHPRRILCRSLVNPVVWRCGTAAHADFLTSISGAETGGRYRIALGKQNGGRVCGGVERSTRLCIGPRSGVRFATMVVSERGLGGARILDMVARCERSEVVPGRIGWSVQAACDPRHARFGRRYDSLSWISPAGGSILSLLVCVGTEKGGRACRW